VDARRGGKEGKGEKRKWFVSANSRSLAGCQGEKKKGHPEGRGGREGGHQDNSQRGNSFPPDVEGGEKGEREKDRNR